MWFTNCFIYSFNEAADFDADTLQDKLFAFRLKPCPPHSRSIFGWSPLYDNAYVHSVADAHVLILGKEERILPQTVIKHALEEKVSSLETAQGKPLKRAEIAHIKEELEFSLLPKAFCVQKKIWCFIDRRSKRLVVNVSSASQGAQVCAMLRKSLGNVTLSPLNVDFHLLAQLTAWLTAPQTLPQTFELMPNCILQAPDDDSKRFVCKGYELPAEEVITLLEQKLEACELSLQWNERISYALTSDLIFKRMKCTDLVQSEIKDIDAEGAIDMLDANLAIMIGDIRELLNDTLAAITHPDAIKTPISEPSSPPFVLNESTVEPA